MFSSVHPAPGHGLQRRAVLTAGLASLLAPSLPAGAQSVLPDLAGDWDILANGHAGRMSLQNLANGFMAGRMYDNNNVLSGYYCAASQQLVLVRQVGGNIGQVFIGQVFRQGLVISGTFYALSQAWGATHGRNAFSFLASRYPLSAPTGTPAITLGSANRACLPPSYQVKNRPAEFGQNWLVPLNFTQSWFSCVSADLTGTLDGGRFFGHYAHLTGSLVLLRMLGTQPFQFYRGQVSGNNASIAGDFFALTTGAGATPQRVMYDWATL